MGTDSLCSSRLLVGTNYTDLQSPCLLFHSSRCPDTYAPLHVSPTLLHLVVKDFDDSTIQLCTKWTRLLR